MTQNFTRHARQYQKHLAELSETIGTVPLGYRGVLDANPLLMLPTDPDELANLLHNFSYDWAVDLDFLDRVARARGLEIDTVLVSQKVRDLIGDN